jgi:hypothetical protein
MSDVLVPVHHESQSAEGRQSAPSGFSPPPQRRHVAGTPAPVLRWELAERGCPRMLATIAKAPIKGLAVFSG